MQTWLVHMRKPRRLSGDLGSAGVLAFQLIVGGNAMVALLHPLFMLGWIREIFLLISQSHGFAAFASAAHYSAAAVVGYVTSAYLGWRGLSHRRVPNKIRILLHTPMHWLLLSLAAWWAAFELIFAPFRWRKTEHGLDEASRQERTIRALLELERHLTGLIKHGELAQIGD